MAYRAKGIQLKNGFTLERVKSFPPAERVASLVGGDAELELIPLSVPFEEMDFLKGVFPRAYEEFHYLDKVLSRQAGAYLMKELAKEHQITNIAAQMLAPSSVLDQPTTLDWIERAAKGYPSSTIASVHNDLDPFKAAMGESLSDLDQRLTTPIWAEQAARGLPESAVDSAFQDFTHTQSAYADRAAMGMRLSENAENLKNSVNDESSLSGDRFQKTIGDRLPFVAEPAVSNLSDSIHNFNSDFLREENKRLQEEKDKQRLRDERQERQAKNSDALLKAQVENDEKAEKDRRFSKRMTVIGLIIAAIGSIGSFISVL